MIPSDIVSVGNCDAVRSNNKQHNFTLLLIMSVKAYFSSNIINDTYMALITTSNVLMLNSDTWQQFEGPY